MAETTDTGSVQSKHQVELTDTQKARIERNRQRALLLRSARLSKNQPYSTSKPENKEQGTSKEEKSDSRNTSWLIDTGGGFLLDPQEEKELTKPRTIISEQAPIIGGDLLFCGECGKDFAESFLYKNYDLSICDKCRDSENGGSYSLITRTEAKKQYLLKDCDLDRREPPLKFILKKNPHNSRWGDMKLYIKTQVESRSHEIWGGEEGLEKQREKILENREEQKQKKFDKKVKELRKAVRTSTWKKDLSKHQHEFGEEMFDEETDSYSKSCETCGHVINYEKM